MCSSPTLWCGMVCMPSPGLGTYLGPETPFTRQSRRIVAPTPVIVCVARQANVERWPWGDVPRPPAGVPPGVACEAPALGGSAVRGGQVGVGLAVLTLYRPVHR